MSNVHVHEYEHKPALVFCFWELVYLTGLLMKVGTLMGTLDTGYV